MNRRDFFRCTAPTAAALFVAPRMVQRLLARPIPTLYGDGIHDDTAAFQAHLNGEPIWLASEQRFGDPFSLSGGIIRITGTVYAP